ncbi:MAG: B12-binding domain-containing radical SAM protein [Lentisphaerae bacterium]|nr:B12-binding domain-containing radical SAM protein [Lentisphaerota bacterium]
MSPARILLLGAEYEENLSLRYLAAVLASHGHQPTITPCAGPKDRAATHRGVKRVRPQLIAASIPFQCAAEFSLDMLTRIRSRGYAGHIVVGGHFPTFEFETILERYPAVDSIGRFEGEPILPALVNAVAGQGDLSDVPNLVYRNNGTIHENPCIHAFPDLDALPHPLRSRWPLRRLGERFATLVGSRGCWHASCAYCCIGAFHKAKPCRFAVRNVDSLASEIAELVHRNGVRIFQFHDDNFLLKTRKDSIARLQDLREALLRENVDCHRIVFLIKARPTEIDDEVADALQTLGCVGVFLGVENASQDGLKAMMRGCSVEDIERAYRSLRSRDITVTFNLLLFHPAATLPQIDENLAFLESHPDSPFDIGRAEIVAGSPMEKQVLQLGIRTGRWPRWDYVIPDPAIRRMFEMYRQTFRSPDSSYRRLSQEQIAQAYQAATFCRLTPCRQADELASEVRQAVAAWNRKLADYLRRMKDAAATDSPPAVSELKAELDLMTGHALKEVRARAKRFSRHQVQHRILHRFGLEQTPAMRHTVDTGSNTVIERGSRK